MLFKEWFRARRLELGLSQDKLGRIMYSYKKNISTSSPSNYVSQIESGKITMLDRTAYQNMVAALGPAPEDVEIPVRDGDRSYERTKFVDLVNKHTVPARSESYHVARVPEISLYHAKHFLGIVQIEPLMLLDCFPREANAVQDFVTVEFSEDIQALHAEIYFRRLNLRFATHSEMLKFAVLSSAWQGKTLIQFGTTFKNGYDEKDTRLHRQAFTPGGSLVGSCIKEIDGGLTLAFVPIQPLVGQTSSWDKEYPKVHAGELILGVPKRETEPVGSPSPPRTLAQLRKHGLLPG